MKEKEPRHQHDLSEEYFFTDLRGIQLISGITAFSAVIITVIAMLFLPTRVDKALITYIAIFVSSFIVIYYTFPYFYLNPRFMLFPDAVFTIAITAIMYALRDFGEFYLIFFLLLIAVDAFAFRFKDFVAVLFMIVGALIFSNLILAREFFSSQDLIFRLIIQLYSVIIVAVVMRFFAKEALTEKKEKEQIRRLAQNTLQAIKQLRNLLDNIGNGIFAVDPQEKIIMTNTAAVNILDWRKAIAGRKLKDIMALYNEDMQKVDPVKKVLETKKTISRSDLLILRGDETINIYINVTPILGPEEQVQGAIVLFRDITREKELEEQKLEFVAVSSHELRTPLTIMEGYLYHLLSNKGLKYDRKTKIFIERAHKSCLDLQHLIADLLEVSKVERNKLKLVLEKIDVADVSNEAVSEFQKKAQTAGLTLTFETKEKKLPKCLVDRGRLKEVLVNLLENAIKFTDKGYIKVKVEKEGGFVKFAVSDMGTGIGKEDQKFIFDKFYRIEGWRTRKTGGSGLGLYIARSIIEKFHGKIWVESKLGKGSTFYFTLPITSKFRRAKETNKGELKEFVSKL